MSRVSVSWLIHFVVILAVFGCSEDSVLSPIDGPSRQELLEAPREVQLGGEMVEYSSGGYWFSDRVRVFLTWRLTRDSQQAESGLEVTRLWVILDHRVASFNSPLPFAESEEDSGSSIRRVITFHQETFHRYRVGAELVVVIEVQDADGNSVLVRSPSAGLAERRD